MHTGQNSIPPENSLPQLGQTRLSSMFMGLIALQSEPEPKATPGGAKASSTVPGKPLSLFHENFLFF